jgi:hypothetical protein
MKDYDTTDLPKKMKVVEKGRKGQKLKRIVKQIDITRYHELEDDDSLLDIGNFAKMVINRRQE